MNNTLRTILIAAVVLVLGVGLFLGGMAYNRMSVWNNGYGPDGMMGSNYGPGGMMNQSNDSQKGYYGPGDMMGSDGYGGMMNSGGYGGMMMGGGMMNSGMMGGYGALYGVEPLSVDETRQAVESYLSSFDNQDLVIEEIMTFDNNAYAIIVEESTGVGAFELLVDPVTKAVFPEYGPNMMWNLKYGMMSEFGGYGMMGPGMMMGGGSTSGGMMDGSNSNGEMDGSGSEDMMDNSGFSNTAQIPNVSADMSVSAEDAVQVAQSYLDTYYPGVDVSDEITAFYGYYTLDIERDGKIIGMLSVNGFTRQIFPHTWHGEFIEMVEADHE